MQLEAAIGAAQCDAQRRAGQIPARLSGTRIAQPRPALSSAIAAAIEPFVGDVIAKMVVICALLRDVTQCAGTALQARLRGGRESGIPEKRLEGFREK